MFSEVERPHGAVLDEGRPRRQRPRDAGLGLAAEAGDDGGRVEGTRVLAGEDRGLLVRTMHARVAREQLSRREAFTLSVCVLRRHGEFRPERQPRHQERPPSSIKYLGEAPADQAVGRERIDAVRRAAGLRRGPRGGRGDGA